MPSPKSHLSTIIHNNGHLLCAIDIETTGLNPKKDDVIEIAVLPLDSFCMPSKQVLPFQLLIKPRREHNPDNIKYKSHFVKCCKDGIDSWRVVDLFREWFEKLQLGTYKKIMPLAHNWPFDREFLIEWMGKEEFESIFHPYYRDTMAMALFQNDLYDLETEPCPFPKINLSYLCNILKVENIKAHEALSDCMATAECYRKLLNYFKKYPSP
jgi:DNA polymerase III alpha subunit (gram-positive type)